MEDSRESPREALGYQKNTKAMYPLNKLMMLPPSDSLPSLKPGQVRIRLNDGGVYKYAEEYAEPLLKTGRAVKA